MNSAKAVVEVNRLMQVLSMHINKISKGAKIRNRYNQVQHLTQDTNGKVTDSQLDTTNESQEVSPFPVVDNKAHVNRRSQNQVILGKNCLRFCQYFILNQTLSCVC